MQMHLLNIYIMLQFISFASLLFLFTISSHWNWESPRYVPLTEPWTLLNLSVYVEVFFVDHS